MFFAKLIEALNRFTASVLDKTGTLTHSRQATVGWSGDRLTEKEEKLVSAATAPSGHPASQSIHDHLRKASSGEGPAVEQWSEIVGEGIECRCEGHHLRLGSPAFIGAPGKGVGLRIDGELRGWFSLERPMRRGLEEVLRLLRQRGQLWLLSGDNDGERERFAGLFERDDHLRFEQSPHDKLSFIRQLREKGETVLMLGDGLNDAGALKQSDLGIVVADQSNNFTPACDAVLHADRFAELPRFLRFARASLRLVFLAYGLALAYNLIGLSFAVQGLLSPVVAAILMPASSVSIVLFGLGASNLLAYRMGLGGGAGAGPSNNNHPQGNKMTKVTRRVDMDHIRRQT